MRYIIKEKKYPTFFEKRLKTGFLFFPKVLWNNTLLKEIRWLEKSTWSQYYSGDGEDGKWKDERWKD